MGWNGLKMCMIIVDNISIFINFVCYVKKRNYTNYLWIKNEAFTFIHDFIHQLFNFSARRYSYRKQKHKSWTTTNVLHMYVYRAIQNVSKSTIQNELKT